jgi:hypothetical protein
MNNQNDDFFPELKHTIFNYALVVRGDLQAITRLKEVALQEGLTIRFERMSTEYLRIVQEPRP